MTLEPESVEVWSTKLEKPNAKKLRKIQESKLKSAYQYLYTASEYYRKRFREADLDLNSVKTLEDLRRVPVTRKTDWISDIDEYPPWGSFSPLTDDAWLNTPWMIFSTSGTTGRPRMFRHTTHDRQIWAWLNARALHAFGVRRGQVALNCFNYGASVAAWGLHEGLSLCGCPVVPGGAMAPERRAALMLHVRPQIILGTPSGLLSLARRIQERGADPSKLGVEILICAGEVGAAVRTTRRHLEDTWQAAVHDDFGCTEVAMGPLGYTCHAEARKSDGEVSVHLMEDTMIVEVLDPNTYEPIPSGEYGTLVVSNLYSEAAPILRFDMGDWVRITDEPCECGRTHRRAIGGLLGRNDHCLIVKGLQFFPSTFENAVRSLKGIGDEYQIEIFPRCVNSDQETVKIVVETQSGVALSDVEIQSYLRGTLLHPDRKLF